MTKFDKPFPTSKVDEKKATSVKLLVKSIIWAFAIFGLLFILILIMILGLLKTDVGISNPLPKNAVLTINFDEIVSEKRPDDIFVDLSETQTYSFYDIIKAINIAAMDKKVKAIVADVSNTNLGMAQIQELRKAVKVFRASGKKAYIYSDGMGSFGGGTAEYYLATAFSEIWMQPNTEIGITGIGLEVPFARDVLDKIGVTPEFYTRYEFKSAATSFMDKTMSNEFRVELTKLGKSFFDAFVNDVAADREISQEKIIELVNNAPISSQEGVNNGLIDLVGYRTDLLEEVKAEIKNAKFFPLKSYAFDPKEHKKGIPAIAFMVIEGEINSGVSSVTPMGLNSVVGSQSVLEQLEDIAKNKEVAALVVRINSPGGSYSASNEIWYGINSLKKRKKIPVVVSMGDYAASGGYFVALSGDHILAENSTITGSIGVLGGKMVIKDLWDKIGVNWDGISFGENARILSSNRKFSEKEKEIFNRSLDNVYKDFTAKVSEARKISLEDLDNLARGRVWTGSDAFKYGLIDGIGGIDEALFKARQLSKLDSAKSFTIIYYPKRKTWAEKVNEMINKGPMVAVEKIMSESGFSMNQLMVLRRLMYNAAMPPVNILM